MANAFKGERKYILNTEDSTLNQRWYMVWVSMLKPQRWFNVE